MCPLFFKATIAEPHVNTNNTIQGLKNTLHHILTAGKSHPASKQSQTRASDLAGVAIRITMWREQER